MNAISNFLIKIMCVLVTLGFTATTAWSASAVAQRYIDQLAQGGPHTIRSVSQSIVSTGERDPELLDVLSEVLLQNYLRASKTDTDANAWASKALGAAGKGRYRAVRERWRR